MYDKQLTKEKDVGRNYEKQPITGLLPGIPNTVLHEAIKELSESRIESVRNILYNSADSLGVYKYEEATGLLDKSIKEIEAIKVKIKALDMLDPRPPKGA